MSDVAIVIGGDGAAFVTAPVGVAVLAGYNVPAFVLPSPGVAVRLDHNTTAVMTGGASGVTLDGALVGLVVDGPVVAIPASTSPPAFDIGTVVGGSSGGGSGDIVRNPAAVFGDGGRTSSLGVGHRINLPLPYAGTIVSWVMSSDVDCTCQVNVFVNDDLISATTGPSLDAESSSASASVPGWLPTLAFGDVLSFEIVSLSGAPKQVSVTLRVE